MEIPMLRFQIPNMTCGGCAKSVTRILQSIDPKARVETYPPLHEVHVETTANESVLLTVLKEAGYPAERLGADQR